MLSKDLLHTVEIILTTLSRCRDDDNYLICKIWSKHFKEKAVTMGAIYKALNDKLIPTPESITRARRKVQEQQKTLRGKKYIQRQKQSDLFRKNI